MTDHGNYMRCLALLGAPHTYGKYQPGIHVRDDIPDIYAGSSLPQDHTAGSTSMVVTIRLMVDLDAGVLARTF